MGLAFCIVPLDVLKGNVMAGWKMGILISLSAERSLPNLLPRLEVVAPVVVPRGIVDPRGGLQEDQSVKVLLHSVHRSQVKLENGRTAS